METLSAVLEDIENYPDWMAKCKKTKVLNKLGPYDFRLLFIQTIGWPVAERYVVLKAITARDIHKGRITVTLLSEKGIGPPDQEDRVRMSDFQGTIELEYEERNKTRIIFTLRADPGGSLPVRAVNGGTLTIPYKTLLGMKKIAKKKKYQQAGAKSELKSALDKFARQGGQ